MKSEERRCIDFIIQIFFQAKLKSLFVSVSPVVELFSFKTRLLCFIEIPQQKAKLLLLESGFKPGYVTFSLQEPHVMFRADLMSSFTPGSSVKLQESDWCETGSNQR